MILEEKNLVHGSLDSSFVLVPPSCALVLGKTLKFRLAVAILTLTIAHPPYWQSLTSSNRLADTAALANMVVRLVENDTITGSGKELTIKEPQKCSSTVLDFIECARRQSASILIQVRLCRFQERSD